MKKLPVLILAIIFLACSSDRERKVSNKAIVPSPIQIKLENGNSNLVWGDTLNLTIRQEEGYVLNNVSLFLNDSVELPMPDFPFEWSWPTSELSLGNNVVRISAEGNGKVESKTLTFNVLSNTTPSKYSYKIVNTYTHDKKAYTQGLIYNDGMLIEGTGQKGLSSVRKVELESGKVIQILKNDENIFGEGICLLNDDIYQISWRSQVGFIYDKNTLAEKGRFYYKGEGWGITTDGEKLYRSDGSNKIHVHRAGDFKQLYTLEVFSNKGAVRDLNELEYIDGKIYANIWQKDDIAIIDPKTGKLEGLINLKGLLPGKLKENTTDVLNGIAYDEAKKRIFVTGKNWPKLYEISIIPTE